MPRIRAHRSDATFHVVGRNPPDELTRFDGQNGIHVWGGVEDIRAWLAAADMALVPLEIARGIQNKVLEAMAMALPVVLTSAAATGIGGTDGKHFVVADSDDELVDRITAFISHPRLGAATGKAARRHVVESLSWQASLAPLTEMLGIGDVGKRDAA
jgi:glycosyltransferase involved in cell wall biosynthesis